MKNKENILCLAYAADNHYAKFCGISLISLFEKNKIFDEIHVYLLDCGIEKDNKEKLTDIANQYNRKIYFTEVENLVNNLNLNMGSRKLAIAAYARLFLGLLIPEDFSKVLYLDCDTIIHDDLIALWDTDLKEYSIAGIRDTVDKFFLKKIGLDKKEYYVNSGVLLINLDRWRSQSIHEEFLQMIEKFKGNVPHHDQGIINAVCKEKKILSPQFNMTTNMYSFSIKTIENIYFMQDYYSQEELDEAQKNPAIIHFTTGIYGRPWEENCTHPMKNTFLDMAQVSPWTFKLSKDSRSKEVKIFGFFYNHFPQFIAETLYKWIAQVIHLKE